MREIKFRAYLKDSKQVVEVRHISFFKGETVVKIYDEPMNIEVWFDLEDLEFLQYTGLKDKNGVEIYEGDIINYERRGKEQVGIVEYYASACSFLLSDTHLLLSAGAFVPYFVGEVIGNIYEKPELLEREAE